MDYSWSFLVVLDQLRSAIHLNQPLSLSIFDLTSNTRPIDLPRVYGLGLGRLLTWSFIACNGSVREPPT